MDFPTTITLSCGSCLASTRRWKTNSLRPIPPGTTSSYPRSCALEAGLAATATAIPSSQPRYCDKRWACRASARGLGQAEASRHAVGEAPPYDEAAEFVADLGILYHSLTANRSATLARGRLRSLRRAASTFGFYLAGIDLRQNSEVHVRTVGELFETTCTASNYAGLPEPARISLLR